MRFLAYQLNDIQGLAVDDGEGLFKGIAEGDSNYPGSLKSLLAAGNGALSEAADLLRSKGRDIDLDEVDYMPPIGDPEKIICVGLNYADHTAETGFAPPKHPTVFARFASSLVGHDSPVVCPKVSGDLDFEGELVAVVGKAGRHISRERALDHIAGYSIFNDVSVRDYQLRNTQWTIGKNFDATGAFGPFFVAAEALPAGCRGLRLTTRLNGDIVQDASTDDMIFDIPTLVASLSESMTLRPGDVIVSGTPAGVGMGRKPPLWMKPGDVTEVEVESVGLLRSPIVSEAKQSLSRAD